MSEVSSDRASQSQELRDLQESYRRRKKEVQTQGEQDLQNAREDARQQLRQETKQSDAAVNHIRQENAERIEQLKKDADQRLIYERRDIAHRYETSKQQTQENLETLRQSLEHKRDDLQRLNLDVNRRVGEARKREDEITGEVHAKHVQRRKDILKEEQQDLVEIHNRAQNMKTKVKEQVTAEARHEIEVHRQKLDGMQAQHKRLYDQQQAWSETQLKSQAESDNRRIEGQRQEFLQRQMAVKSQSQNALKEEKDTSEQRLKTVAAENEAQVTAERQKGHLNMEKTQNFYSNELARIHKEGDAAVHDQTEMNRAQVTALKTDQKQRIEGLKTNHEDSLKEIDQLYKQRAKQNEIYYKQALLQQRHEHDSAHAKNQKVFEESVRLQKENFAQSLKKEKREIMLNVGKYREAQDDPFYRLAQIDGSVTETDDHYIIRAQVPAHEKENVKITVKDDRVVVQGSRRFKDRVNEPQGSHLTTENYQTFREVIPLDHPVREKHVFHSWENGILTVKVPKA